MKRNPILLFCIAYIVLLLFVFGLLCSYPKLELHLLLNSYHTGILDTFFKYYSTLAEWPLYILALLPILWKKKEITIFFALCELSAGAIIQVLKYLIKTERPVSAFENCHDMVLPLVPGVDLHHGNSFPSGHASTFFVFSTCCALILAYHYQKSKRHNYGTDLMISLAMLALLLMAALGAYSRVYLSQHFLSDVCVGSIIGFVTTCLFFYFAGNKILKLKNE